MPSLDQLFAEIRSVYFPRWRDGNRWRVTADTRSDETCEDGYCDDVARVISIASPRRGDGETATVLLIHEIAHAVAGPGHGKRFRTRLRTAEQRARASNDDRVSELLADEIRVYEDPLSVVTARQIYCAVEDAVAEGADSWRSVQRWLSAFYGLTAQELAKHYPATLAVYRLSRRASIARAANRSRASKPRRR